MIKKEDVKNYERTRYSKPDQALVNYLEKRLVRGFIRAFGLESKRVLDIPCGYGRFSGILLNGGVALTSADISLEMVRRTRENSQEIPADKQFVSASIKALPFRDKIFDVTLTARLLHHNFTREERLNILRELARVSKGLVIVTMYRKNFFHSLTRRLRRMKRIIVMLSDDEIEAEVHESGLKILKKKKLIPLFHSQLFLVLKKR